MISFLPSCWSAQCCVQRHYWPDKSICTITSKKNTGVWHDEIKWITIKQFYHCIFIRSGKGCFKDHQSSLWAFQVNSISINTPNKPTVLFSSANVQSACQRATLRTTGSHAGGKYIPAEGHSSFSEHVPFPGRYLHAESQGFVNPAWLSRGHGKPWIFPFPQPSSTLSVVSWQQEPVALKTTLIMLLPRAPSRALLRLTDIKTHLLPRTYVSQRWTDHSGDL